MEEPEISKIEAQTLVTTSNVRDPALKQLCSFPYLRCYGGHCRHRQNRYNFTPSLRKWWLNNFEREKEELVCISPQVKDSYEMLCSIPLCDDKPSTSLNTEPGEQFIPVHCTFCNKSLYTGGTIYDLRESVEAIKRQSTDRGDDIADRIGLRTRITVHKSCFEEYIKRPITYLPDRDSNCSHSESSR